MIEFTSKEQCVLCNGRTLIKLTNFPPTPIANQLLDPKLSKSLSQKRFPLNLCMCSSCCHIQIDTLIDPNILFSDYPYLSNSGSAMSKRLDALAEKYIKEFQLKESDFVLEIGSNDGYLLSKFQEIGCTVLGIDPAIIPTNLATQNGVPTIVDFFSSKVASNLRGTYPLPKIIIANNVLAHSNELQDIFKGIFELMNEETTAIIEFSYVLDVYEKLLFDTIYHEHTSYHSLLPLSIFLNSLGLKVIHFERFAAHGGSARVYLALKSSNRSISASVLQASQREESIKLHDVASWKTFQIRIDKLSREIKSVITTMKSSGQTLIGYGVPAKFSSLFHILNLSEDKFDFIVDDNPYKVGKFAPGTSIIVSDPDLLPVVDNVIIFSWNYSDSIIEKLLNRNNVRRHIIVPLPEFRVIDVGIR